MGFYLRKSISVGPLRFNLSRSGVGVSAGVKGLRLGAGPRGNYVHMGRGGLYFRHSLGASHIGKRSSHPIPVPPSRPEGSTGPLRDLESGSVLEMTDGSSAELLKELNEKRKKIRFLPGAIVLSAVGMLLLLGTNAPAWLVALWVAALFSVCWVAATQDTLRTTTVILYDLEPEIERAYRALHDAFSELRGAQRAWHIEAHGEVSNRKYHAGASGIIRRKRILFSSGQPPLVKTNIDVPLIPVGRQTLAFLPDCVLVCDVAAVGAVSYADLVTQRAETQFIEGEGVANDAAVVGKTWQYVNKQGGPDRRFKNNRELPVCLYDQLRFSSTSGLNEIVQLSRRGAGNAFVSALTGMQDLSAVQRAQQADDPLRRSKPA